MALFTSYDMDELKSIQKSARDENFLNEYGDMIDNELADLEDWMRINKTFVFDMLKARITDAKISQVEIATIRSFDFSRIGGFFASHDTGASYGERACESFPESFADVVSRFRLWKSKNFLIRLADRLQLPNNMKFVIRSHIVEDDFKRFRNYNVTEYTTDLVLVLSFE
jgi:hypothetical protein